MDELISSGALDPTDAEMAGIARKGRGPSMANHATFDGGQGSDLKNAFDLTE